MKQPFKIPLQTEVAAYMREKMNWPEKFCSYYAEKFWNFYNSNGWKVSGKAAMKNWQSAFISNWRELKFKNDADFLTRCMANDNIPNKQQYVLNDWLLTYEKNWEKINDQQLGEMYDYMKPLGEIRKRLTDDEVVRVKNHADKKGIVSGKALAVKIIFDKMITYHAKFIQ